MNHLNSFRFLIMASGIVLAVTSTSSRLCAEPAQLAEDGEGNMPVIVSEAADDRVRNAAASLSEYLQNISGGEFPLATGDGSSGIVVGVEGSFSNIPFDVHLPDGVFQKETYRLKSSSDGLWIIGASPLAVRDAVWDVLYRLGYRQFFPGDTWEVVPERNSLSVDADTRERPDFIARRIWYNWGMRWGYNREPYRNWVRRNRVVRGVQIKSGHAYGKIRRANRKAFEKHPEYLALVDGKRGGNKFCISNEGLRQLVVDYAVDYFRENPDRTSMSMEPSDGGGWCECEECRAMGTPSTRAVTLANEVAEAVNNLNLGDKYVGLLAYNQHSPPPEIEVHPKVVVSVATAFLQGKRSLDEIIEGWNKQGVKRLGIYDYFSVVAWDGNMPGEAKAARPHAVANGIRRFHEKGVRFYDCESGDAWGPYGLGYYVASRVFWDVDDADRVDAIIDDFLTRAFGPAREVMEQFYHLINADDRRRSTPDRLARMYRLLKKARKRAGGHSDVRERIDDLVLYTRYVELRHRFDEARKTERERAKQAVLKFVYRIRETSMVHSYGLWARMIGQKAAHSDDHPLKDDRPIRDEDIQRYLREGIQKYEPVEVNFKPVDFSRHLVPAAERLEFPDVSHGQYPNVPQSRQTYYVWVQDATDNLPLQVTVEEVHTKREPALKLFAETDADDEPDGPVDVSRKPRPDNKTREVVLETPHKGLHRVEVYDGADFTRIDWPEDLPVSVPSGMDTGGVKKQFRGRWTMYFYVPEGTDVVGGWAERIARWAPPVSGVMKDADGNVVHNFRESGGGWFSVSVPEGQDGRLWSFENSHGIRRLATVPPFLAIAGDKLLLPEEVVESDER